MVLWFTEVIEKVGVVPLIVVIGLIALTILGTVKGSGNGKGGSSGRSNPPSANPPSSTT